MNPKNVFALMVGIDKYQNPVPALEGCVNDMHAFAGFVETRTRRKGIPLHMNILENQDATRMKIVEQFERHLRQAGKDDMIVFYYSGHGSQEPAHSLFWPLEEDRKNETLVCYDSRMPDGMDLADKELATLIDLVTKKGAQMAVVMDCCNSGSATRSAMVESTPTGTKVRQSPTFEGDRTLDSYILPRDLTSSRGAFSFGGSGSVANQLIVPTPRHVAMSATQPFELAKETWLGGSPRGVFTYSLMEVLGNAVGQLSYSDVVRQVRTMVKQRTTEQSPQLYAETSSDLNLEFLGGVTAQKMNYYFLSHHDTLGWQIDAGATQGLPSQTQSDTKLAVFDPTATDDDLLNPAKAKGKASIREVKPSSSTVRLEGSLVLDKSKSFRTTVTEMALEKLLVHVRGDDPHGVNTAITALGEAGEPSIYLKVVENAGQADYQVVVKDNQYIVIRTTDADDQPLIGQIDGYSVEQARKAAENMVHIAKWENALSMKNPGSRLATSAIRLDLLAAKQDRPIPQGPQGHVFETSPRASQSDLPTFRVRLTNQSGEKLYVSLLYLGSQFEVETSILAQGGVWLDPGAEVFALNGKAFMVGINPAHLALGRTELAENFKVVFSTEELNMDSIKQKGLDAPKVASRSASGQSSRSLIFAANDRGSNSPTWNASTTTITVRAV